MRPALYRLCSLLLAIQLDRASSQASHTLNIAGFTAFEFEIGGKWLELKKEGAPDTRRVIFMFNLQTGLPYAEKFAQSIASVAPARGIELGQY
jgi:hypothetical protein